MKTTGKDVEWIQRGSQRAAVAQVLRKPMTGKEICVAARTLNPRIQLRDIWFLMKQFTERSVVQCLNPRQTTGRLYCFTDYGRRIMRDWFGISIKPVVHGVNWKKYSLVIRAKVRKLTLLRIAELTTKEGKTASEIRKSLREEYPVGLNPVIRAVKELVVLGLIRAKEKRDGIRNTYKVTPTGRLIVSQLLA